MDTEDVWKWTRIDVMNQARIDRKSVGPLTATGDIRFHMYYVYEVKSFGVLAKSIMDKQQALPILIPWHDINWMEWPDKLHTHSVP